MSRVVGLYFILSLSSFTLIQFSYDAYTELVAGVVILLQWSPVILCACPHVAFPLARYLCFCVHPPSSLPGLVALACCPFLLSLITLSVLSRFLVLFTPCPRFRCSSLVTFAPPHCRCGLHIRHPSLLPASWHPCDSATPLPLLIYPSFYSVLFAPPPALALAGSFSFAFSKPFLALSAFLTFLSALLLARVCVALLSRSRPSFPLSGFFSLFALFLLSLSVLGPFPFLVHVCPRVPLASPYRPSVSLRSWFRLASCRRPVSHPPTATIFPLYFSFSSSLAASGFVLFLTSSISFFSCFTFFYEHIDLESFSGFIYPHYHLDPASVLTPAAWHPLTNLVLLLITSSVSPLL